MLQGGFRSGALMEPGSRRLGRNRKSASKNTTHAGMARYTNCSTVCAYDTRCRGKSKPATYESYVMRRSEMNARTRVVASIVMAIVAVITLNTPAQAQAAPTDPQIVRNRRRGESDRYRLRKVCAG